MRIFELFEVSDVPRRFYTQYCDYRVYPSAALYLEAECCVDCMGDLDGLTDEMYERLVDQELNNILDILKEYGRYPATGTPKFIAFEEE